MAAPNGHSEAQQVFRLSTAQDNVHLVHEAKNVATQASLIHLAKPKEAARWICKIHHRANCLQEAEMSAWKSFNPLSQWLLFIKYDWRAAYREGTPQGKKREVLISLSNIRLNLFCLVNFSGLRAFSDGYFFLCYSQAGCISCTTLIFLAKETRATTFWQLPRLSWLIESDSEHMHTQRHTPTHTVGGDRQLRGRTHSHRYCIWWETRRRAERGWQMDG